MFYLNTKVMFGKDALQRSVPLLAGLGQRALLVTGKRSASASGALADLEPALTANGIQWHTFDEVSENPDLDTIMAGKERFLSANCDFVIGIGGGSPLDAAKAISMAAANDLKRSQLYSTEEFLRAHPIVAIPTTAGTGSEVTQYSVLNDNKRNIKAGWGHELAFPTLAIIDPRYTFSCSYHVTLNTAVDALSHLLEGLYSQSREPIIYPLIHKGIALIVQNLKTALQEPQNYAAREALALASMYGGMAIAQSSTSLQHSIGYPLTTTFDVPHGLANGIVMPQIMELFWDAAGDLVGDALGSFGYTRAEFLAWLESLNLNVEMTIDEQFIQDKVPEVMASRNMANNPLTVDAEDIAAIYRSLI